jgi:hypothetical protein
MSASLPFVERRWYRIAESVAAASALAALFYFVAVSRGWLTGDVVRPSTLLNLAASTCLLGSFVVRRRAMRWAFALQALGVLFLALSIVRLGHGQ